MWDPVTGRQVLITDAGNKHQTADDDSDASSDSSDAPAQSAEPTDTTHNLLLHPFPTSPPQHIFDALLTKLDRVSFNSAALVLLANGVHWLCPIPKSLSAAISLFSLGGVYLYTHSAKLDLERSVDRLRHELHLARATHYSPPSPESAEWLNGLINGIWPLIDTKLFEGVVDMVEDIMHSSLPKMIQSVKISDLSQGDNPFRLIYMRRLPPKEKNGQKTCVNGSV